MIFVPDFRAKTERVMSSGGGLPGEQIGVLVYQQNLLCCPSI